MTDNKTPRTQLNATRAWEERNREKTREDNYRRTARLFVRKYAKEEDIKELLEIYKKENKNYKKS